MNRSLSANRLFTWLALAFVASETMTATRCGDVCDT